MWPFEPEYWLHQVGLFALSGILIVIFNLAFTFWAKAKNIESRIKSRSEVEDEELKKEIEEITEGGVEE